MNILKTYSNNSRKPVALSSVVSVAADQASNYNLRRNHEAGPHKDPSNNEDRQEEAFSSKAAHLVVAEASSSRPVASVGVEAAASSNRVVPSLDKSKSREGAQIGLTRGGNRIRVESTSDSTAQATTSSISKRDT
jgi:hypothetical protein